MWGWRSSDDLYVESRIRCGLDDLWSATQDPACPQRWDVRFSEVAHAAAVVVVTGEGLPSGRTPLLSAPDHQPPVGALP